MASRGKRVGTALALAGVAGVVLANGTATTASLLPSARPPRQQLPDASAVAEFRGRADADEVITATVRLADKPLAQLVGEADEAGAPLPAAVRAGAAAAIAAGHTSVRAVVAQSGLTVLHEFHTTVNAIVVRGPRRSVERLAAVSGVISVRPVSRVRLANTASNSFTSTEGTWAETGLTGRGIKVAIIDDGIDYTHATFAGAGVPSAYAANDPTVIEPGSFPTPKVAGGYDFVGDAYDPDGATPAATIPQPDPDPLACGEHGTHVAGTAAGFGVRGDGTTFAGPYTADGVAGLRVGPGSAPEATIYAYKVFGCDGASDSAIIAAAVERAVADGVDVINLSLGSPWGTNDGLLEEAVNNAVLARVIVVAAAGNAGGSGYMVDAPGSADRAISVAAVDASTPSFQGVTVGGGGVIGINANAGALPVTGPVRVLRNADGMVGLGCEAAEFAAVQVGDIVVTQRGSCDRRDRVVLGHAAGAAAVVMINNNPAGLPPFEGPVSGVTIPFIGVALADRDAIVALDGTSITVASGGDIVNASFATTAEFSSGGPRSGDAAPKPDLTAPGVSVFSARAGSGAEPLALSGTSMSAPHVAGVAALVIQAHPTWNPSSIKSALLNTAAAGKVVGYDPRRDGTGLIQPRLAVGTQVVMTSTRGTGAVTFGVEQLRRQHFEDNSIAIRNRGSAPVTYTLAAEPSGDTLGAIVGLSAQTVTVPPGGSVEVKVSLSISLAAAAALPAAEASTVGKLVTVRGAIVATPVSPTIATPVLRMAWSVTPRALSSITAIPGDGSIALRNRGLRSGTADFFAWQLSGERGGPAQFDLRAAGIQQLPGDAVGADPGDTGLVFAVSTFGRWSNPAQGEIDVEIDNDGDGFADVLLALIDNGMLTAGDPDGVAVAATVDLASGNVLAIFPASAPMGGSVALLPTLASAVGPRFEYSVSSFDQTSQEVDHLTGAARWDIAAPPISTGQYLTLLRRQRTTVTVDVSADALAATPALGWMVVSPDDVAGSAQADLVLLAAAAA